MNNSTIKAHIGCTKGHFHYQKLRFCFLVSFRSLFYKHIFIFELLRVLKKQIMLKSN